MEKCVKLTRLVALVAATLAVSGCTTVKGWFVDDNKQEKPQQIKDVQLILPEGFSNPKKSNEYAIKPGRVNSKEQFFTSPTMVLAFFEGSWINEDDRHKAKIMVEKPALVKDLPSFVEQGVQSYLEEKQYKSTKTETGYRITSYVQKEQGFWFWERDVNIELFEYDLNIDIKPHGRSGEIFVDLVKYEKLDEELASKQPKLERVETLAAHSLNQFMLELDYLYRVELKKEQASSQLTISLETDVAGNQVIVSQTDISNVWEEVEYILKELGFKIEEDDDELHIFELSYDKSKKSTWDEWFGSDFGYKLNLPADQYELALTSTTNGVQLKFRDKNSLALDAQSVSEIYELIKAIVEEEEIEI